MPTSKLFLLDGMALVYRAHFAFMNRPVVTSTGINTSAVLGFANTLLDLLETHHPTHLAVAFDTPHPTERHRLYPAYKAQREAMPEDLATAIPYVKRLLEAFRIPVLEKPGYEADDVIGTLARLAETQGYETYMVTPDKDYGQLVDAQTFMMKPGRGGGEIEILGVPEICDLWGVERPEQVIDILGLMGDSSDNIPGVPGIGPKTAGDLIARFGSLEEVLAHSGELKGKQKERLETYAEQARLSQTLATINCQVPMEESPADLRCGERDDHALQDLLLELEFNNLGRRLFGSGFGGATASPSVQGDLFEEGLVRVNARIRSLENTDHRYELVQNPAKIPAILKAVKEAGRVSFDLETDSLNPRDAALVAISLCTKPHAGWMIPCTPETQRERLNDLAPLWTDASILKIGQNLKFDLGVLANLGVDVAGPFFDTMVAHALLEPEQRHGMDAMSEALLGYRPIPISELIGPPGPGQRTMRDVDPGRLCDYAVEDADVTLQLYEILHPRIAEAGQEQVFTEIEMPLLPVLVRMETEGIALDAKVLEAFRGELVALAESYKERVFELAGESFNLNSPKQLGVVLFEKLQLGGKPKKTKTGQYSTNEQVLSELAPHHEIVRHILDYREAEKLRSTYVDALPGQVHPRTGRVHTSYSQTGAATGRLSSNDPNLQNIPVRTALGREIRKAFVPRQPGFVLLSADYSQIELRVMASMSGDAGMCQAFADGLDIHAATAARVYGVPLDEVTPEMRRKSKMVNFGIIYGISAFGLSQRLGISRGEAAEIIQEYFKQYPAVKGYMDSTIETCRKQGYVETLTGRRRSIRDINSRNATIRQAAERTAINSPIQGTAADMIKIAMTRVDGFLREGGYRTRMLLQVHDELVFDLCEEEAVSVKDEVRRLMRKALSLRVPIVVDLGTGANWLEAH